MTVRPEEISWGAYKDHEGPFFRGGHPFVLPSSPSEEERLVYLTSATEGRMDAVNAYDGQILSITMMQVTERQYFTASQSLGYAITRCPRLASYLDPALEISGSTFRQTPRGWRFHLRGEPVRTVVEQEQLMLGCDGRKGSWGPPDSPQRAYAKIWAAAMASFWGDEEARQIQVGYAASRIRSYAFYGSAALIKEAAELGTDISRAFEAAYLTFAVNNPTRASLSLKRALESWQGPRWTRDWLIHVLQTLTFGPQIATYPVRYNAIRGPIERLYGVDLPDLADELRAWQRGMGIERTEKAPSFVTTKEIQELLISLGYDLGPWGADGKEGPKTRAAIRSFQRDQGLAADGIVGPRTRARMAAMWAEQQAGG